MTTMDRIFLAVIAAVSGSGTDPRGEASPYILRPVCGHGMSPDIARDDDPRPAGRSARLGKAAGSA